MREQDEVTIKKKKLGLLMWFAMMCMLLCLAANQCAAKSCFVGCKLFTAWA